KEPRQFLSYHIEVGAVRGQGFDRDLERKIFHRARKETWIDLEIVGIEYMYGRIMAANRPYAVPPMRIEVDDRDWVACSQCAGGSRNGNCYSDVGINAEPFAMVAESVVEAPSDVHGNHAVARERLLRRRDRTGDGKAHGPEQTALDDPPRH